MLAEDSAVCEAKRVNSVQRGVQVRFRRHRLSCAMLNWFTYDFGYSSTLRYAMVAPLILAAILALLALWRSWPRWSSCN